MAWAKLHTDILGDPKLMRAARKGAKALVYLPWLIAFAKQADDGGRLTVGGEPAEAADIAALVPGGRASEITAALRALTAIGVLRDEDGTLAFVQWESRSGAKDSDAPSAVYQRVKKHREKVRASQPPKAANGANGRDNASVTDDNADDNALHSPLSVTFDNAREKRREEERREEKNRTEKSGARARVVPEWATRVAAHWISRVGKITPAKVAQLLGPAVASRDESAVVRGMDGWLDARHAGGRDPKLEWFAEVAVAWADRAAEPLVDADGILTARGLAVLSAP